MREKVWNIKNNFGLHARSAANFVRKASEFQSMIQVECGNKRISAKSLLGILSLNLNFQDDNEQKIKIIADGVDEERAVDELCALMDNCFMPVQNDSDLYKNGSDGQDIQGNEKDMSKDYEILE